MGSDKSVLLIISKPEDMARILSCSPAVVNEVGLPEASELSLPRKWCESDEGSEKVFQFRSLSKEESCARWTPGKESREVEEDSGREVGCSRESLESAAVKEKA